MLAALLENNNNARAAAAQSFKFDSRSSSGRSTSYDSVDNEQRHPRYDFVDIAAAMATFPEIADEHPIVRAARRQRWISDALPYIKSVREKREAAVFLTGARLADAAAEERHAAQDRLKIEQIIEIIDEVRGTAPQVPQVQVRRSYERGGNGMGMFIGGLVVGGLLVGLVLSKRKDQG